ncbi:MAG TPA: hypothetical protein VM901_06320 [Bdellovibrionota bacterium]|nr:hypothetical protein [Bdellovibrionota bacterium]
MSFRPVSKPLSILILTTSLVATSARAESLVARCLRITGDLFGWGSEPAATRTEAPRKRVPEAEPENRYTALHAYDVSFKPGTTPPAGAREYRQSEVELAKFTDEVEAQVRKIAAKSAPGKIYANQPGKPPAKEGYFRKRHGFFVIQHTSGEQVIRPILSGKSELRSDYADKAEYMADLDRQALEGNDPRLDYLRVPKEVIDKELEFIEDLAGNGVPIARIQYFVTSPKYFGNNATASGDIKGAQAWSERLKEKGIEVPIDVHTIPLEMMEPGTPIHARMMGLYREDGVQSPVLEEATLLRVTVP